MCSSDLFVVLLLVTYLATTAALRDQIHREVSEKLETIAIEAEADGIAAIVQDIDERTAQKGSTNSYYFLGDAQGKKLAGNIDNVEIKSGWQEIVLKDNLNAATANQMDEDHQLWGIGQRLPEGSFLWVGQDSYRVLAAQVAIINSFAWSAGISLLLATLVAIVLSQSFLRRIDNINSTSLAIIDGRLKERIPVRGSKDEIDRLSMNLNRLFDSNQALLQSLKQVSTNVAHDLRSPLARLRQGLEEALFRAKSKNEYEAAITTAIGESDQLLATFAALLRIAQIESGAQKEGFKSVDLSNLLNRIISVYKAVVEDERKELLVTIAENVSCHGDSEMLLQMIVNLLENAIRHTPPKTRISVSLLPGPDGAIVNIADSGFGIPADHREKVFEQFYRLDSSRTSSGNGLGLALVAAVCKLHGIKIELSDNAPGLMVSLAFIKQS